MPNGVGYGEGCPLSSRLEGLGSVVSSPSGVRGTRDPAENGFWGILKATERSFLYLYDKNLRGTICISVPYSKYSGGGLVPRDLRPCMYSQLHVLYVCYVCVFNEYRLQERDLSVIYMAFVALVFFIYSLYHSCTRIRPKVSKKRHDVDVCGIESARRNCADATQRYH